MTQTNTDNSGCGCLLMLLLIAAGAAWFGLSYLRSTDSLLLPEEEIAPAVPKQSEAKTYVSSMNRAQEAYYRENQEFTTNIEALGQHLPIETQNYSYRIKALGSRAMQHHAVSKEGDATRSYTGLVWLAPDYGDVMITSAKLCESLLPTGEEPPAFKLSRVLTPDPSSVPCPTGYQDL